MSSMVIFELCAETIDACLAARDGGADRIELCSALSEDGLTPSYGFIEAAVKLSGLPIHVLIRPRDGDFVYSNEEFQIMREDVRHAKALGASGVVLGVLKPDATVDLERTRELVKLASPLAVTFHRAFDVTPSLEKALEQVISIGCNRILTSGGAPDALQGIETLRHLNQLAAGRIDIAAGGGLRLDNAIHLIQSTGLRQIHGSLRRKLAAGQTGVLSSEYTAYRVDPEDIRALKRSLHSF